MILRLADYKINFYHFRKTSYCCLYHYYYLYRYYQIYQLSLSTIAQAVIIISITFIPAITITTIIIIIITVILLLLQAYCRLSFNIYLHSKHTYAYACTNHEECKVNTHVLQGLQKFLYLSSFYQTNEILMFPHVLLLDLLIFLYMCVFMCVNMKIIVCLIIYFMYQHYHYLLAL